MLATIMIDPRTRQRDAENAISLEEEEKAERIDGEVSGCVIWRC